MHPIHCTLPILLLAACGPSNQDTTLAAPPGTHSTPAPTSTAPSSPSDADDVNDRQPVTPPPVAEPESRIPPPTTTPPITTDAASDGDHAAEIKKAIAEDVELSLEARTVQVVAVSGKVTLTGNVPTAEDRARIEQIARASAATTFVDDRIEVVPH